MTFRGSNKPFHLSTGPADTEVTMVRRAIIRIPLVVAALLSTTIVAADGACPEGTQFYVSRREAVPTVQNPFFVHALATGDFNGDGLQDAVLGHVKFNQDVKFQPEILLNDGNGGFFDGTTQVITGPIPTLWHPREIVVADFNGDGKDDIFIVAHGIDSLAKGEPNKLLLSTLNNKLVDASNRIPQVNDFSHAVAAGDIDGDGDVDLVVGNLGGEFQGPYILINDGTGSFAMNTSRLPQKEFCCDGNMGAVLLFDVNKDGDIDLIIGDHYRDRSRIYLNDGRGYFRDAARIDLPESFIGGSPVYTVDIQAADLDRDGHVDLILSQTRRDPLHYLGRKIQILMGDGTGHFRDETGTRIPSAHLDKLRQEWYMSLYLVDFNRDGYPDIVVSIPITGGATVPPETPYVFINDGHGNFGPLTASVFGPQPDRILGPLIPLDADGDGGLDFFSAGFLYQLFRQQAPYSDCTPLARVALNGTRFNSGDTITIGFAAQNPADGEV